MCNNRKEKYTDSLCLAWQCVMWLGEGMFGSIVWLLLNLDTEELCTTSLTVRSQITDIQLNWLTLTRRNFNRAHDIFFQLKNTHLFPKEKIQSLLYPNPQSRIFFFFLASWDPNLHPECSNETSSILTAHTSVWDACLKYIVTV